MPRLQRVLSNLYMTVIISAVVHWWLYPEHAWIVLAYLVRIAGTALVVYILYWLGDTYEIRRRQ